MLKKSTITKSIDTVLGTGWNCAAVGILAGSLISGQVAAISDSATIEEIVVTVERRSQDIQDVAGVVQAFSADDLQRDGVGSEIRNLQVAVPGLNISNQEGNVQIFIRGVGSSNNTELGDPAVASHINGVYIPRPRGFGSQFYDVERVELHKGPQGTLRGRNSVAGTINIITKKPDLEETSGTIQVGIGSDSQRSFEAALNIPISETSGLRIAGFSEVHDAYQNNAGAAQAIEAAGAEDEYGVRASFLWEPSDRLSLDLVVDYTEEGGTGYSGSPLFNAFSAGNRFEDLNPRDIVYRGPQGELDNEVYGITGKLLYDFDRVGLEFLTSFRSVDFFQLSGNTDGTAFPGRDLSIGGAVNFDNFGGVYFSTLSDAYVNELRLFSTGDSGLIWSAGLFRLDEDQEVGFFSVNDSGIFFSGVEFGSPDVQSESTAVYFDATFDLSDQFRVKGGIRYTDEEKSRFGIGGNYTLGLGSDGNGCCFVTRFGTEGFVPALNERPSFIAPDSMDNAAIAEFLLDGFFQPGQRDTLAAQIAGVADGSSPNGTCIDNVLTDPTGTQDCTAAGEFGFFVLGAPGQQQGSVDDSYVDWRLGAEWDWSDNNMLYATISTGTKASGFNDNVTAEIAPTFGVEELTVYEIGSKNVFDLGDQRLALNGSLFYYDYTDLVAQSLIQVGGITGPNTSGFSLLNENVADASIFGLELDGSINLPNGFNLSARASFLDTEVESGELADVRGQDFSLSPSAVNINLAGNKLPLASDFQLILKLQQEFELFNGYADWQILANYRSDYFLSIFNEDDIVRPQGSTICGSNDAIACGFETEQPGFWTVNISAGYTDADERWRLEGFVSNLFDEESSQQALIGNSLNTRFLNLPRTAGVRLRINL